MCKLKFFTDTLHSFCGQWNASSKGVNAIQIIKFSFLTLICWGMAWNENSFFKFVLSKSEMQTILNSISTRRIYKDRVVM